tara:strand:+ start:1880 stop:2596 length:717 start_codon:yes stop_codon:yes gene_type:complete
MKKSIITIILLVFVATQSFAHYLWIETNPSGKIDQEQEVKVFYGEYTYGVIEKVNGDAFPKVKDFTLWIVDANGVKKQLKVTAKENHYLAHFTPKKNGTYTVVLDNDKIDVIDYTQYDFGIFKTHYNSNAKIQVGEKISETIANNKNGITIKDISKTVDEIKLQVLYKRKALKENEVKIYVADLWSKTLYTDKDGFISFKLPWKSKYILETTFNEKVPGKFRGKEYQFIWHCATYCIK